MTIWTAEDSQRVEQRLRKILAEGSDLATAIRTVHEQDGIGRLRLCRPVEMVSGLGPKDAKRLISQAVSHG